MAVKFSYLTWDKSPAVPSIASEMELANLLRKQTHSSDKVAVLKML
jgi:hypothetical protein